MRRVKFIDEQDRNHPKELPCLEGLVISSDFSNGTLSLEIDTNPYHKPFWLHCSRGPSRIDVGERVRLYYDSSPDNCVEIRAYEILSDNLEVKFRYKDNNVTSKPI